MRTHRSKGGYAHGQEQRRLFFVGITRAMRKLTLSHVRWRVKWGQKQSQLPSRFLKELDRKFIDELDYARHMQQKVTTEESTSFFTSLKAMLAEGAEP